jgi:3',5'-cyclic AMP phosphodiesterase CpdA
MSDIHVRPTGQLYKDVADSNSSLVRAIDHLHQLDQRPDLVLVTGDLTDYGQTEEYDSAREILASFQIPLFLMPGNHDDRENFRSAFTDHKYLPSNGPLNYCIDDHQVRIIALDSCVPNEHHGDLAAETLSFLEQTLQSAPAKPTIIALHHPPFRCGIPYMDQYRYFEAEELANIVGKFSNVEAIVCGHVHRTMTRRWAGTVVCACPSTTTEIALQMQPNAPGQSYLGPSALMLHLWTPTDGLVSHVSYIGDYPGPYAFF